MAPHFRPVTTAEHLLYLLGEHGIEHLFLNPGTDSAPLQEAMLTLPGAGVAIPSVHTSTFEAVSLSAAHAFYQATGRPQCLFVHVDAGTQNLGAMLHDAYRDRAGVIVIAGRTPYSESPETRGGRTGYIQWLQDMPDQPGIVRGYAKLIIDIVRPDMVDRAIGRAVQVATSYPAGPVYLTVARDVLMDPAAPEASRTTGFAVPVPPAMAPGALDEVARLVIEKERPLLVTSRVGRTAAGFSALTRLAELTGTPVVRGADPGPLNIATLHPLHRRQSTSAARSIREADLLLIVESEVPFIPRDVQPAPDATVVHIDPDPLKTTMPLWSYPVDLGVLADGPTALGQLVAALESAAAASPETAARFALRRATAEHLEPLPARSGDPSEPLSPLDIVLALNELIAPEDIVLEEAVTNSRVVYENVVRTRPGTVAGPFAPALGWALGGAIGLKLANPRRRVVSVCGDGSFLFAVPSSALMMAAEMQTPFLTVVINNDGYRASRLPVYDIFPEGASARAADAVGTRFNRAPDIAMLARACHAHGERVERQGELGPALTRCFDAIDSGQAAVLDAHVTQN